MQKNPPAQSAAPQDRPRGFLRSPWLPLVSVPLAFCFTFLFFGPLDVFANNALFFSFTWQDFLLSLLLLAAGVFLALFLPALLLRRWRLPLSLYLSLVFGLTLCGYLQGTFLNPSLGILDGYTTTWSDAQIRLNTALWAALLLLTFGLCLFARRAWNLAVRYLSLLLVAMQLVSLFATWFATPFPKRTDAYLSTAEMFTLSEEENVIVFVLDACDNEFIDVIEYDDPDFLAPLGGFTRYTNITSAYGRTFPAMTYLATGVPLDYTVPTHDYMAQAFRDSAFLPQVRAQGYGVQMFSTVRSIAGDAAAMEGLLDNVRHSPRVLNQRGVLGGLLTLSAYRYMPVLYKNNFSIATDDFEAYVSVRAGDAYQMDDPGFLERLRAGGISATAERKQFLLYHLSGSHAPFTMDAAGNRSSASSVLAQTRGCFQLLYEYLEQLKAADLFDYATIIVTADHGKFYGHEYETQRETPSPIFFVKLSGETAGQPLERSEAPLCHADFHPTVLDAIGGDGFASEQGLPAYAVGEEEFRIRYFVNTHREYVDTYAIDGPAGDPDHWYFQGQEISPYPFYQ